MTDIADTDEMHADHPDGQDQPAASRRSLLSKGAIAAAVGAAAGVALGEKASAGDGNAVNMQQGAADANATVTTSLSGGSTFQVTDGASVGSASIYGVAGDSGGDYGVHGRHTGTTGEAGVYGSSNNNAAGVYGYHEGDTAPGPGVKGESIGSAGVYGENVNTGGGGIGVHGVTTGTSGGSGVRGESTGTQGAGVYGSSTGTNAFGVRGQTTALGASSVYGNHVSAAPSEVGIGVRGVSDNGTGVSASGTTADVVATGVGIIRIAAEVTPTITPSSSGTVGSIARTDDGSLWYCYAAGQWQKLAPVDASPQFNPVTPFRVYDSRQEIDGRFDGDENRTISVADSRDVDTYAVVTADAVPVGATAVTGNVVAIGTTDLGFLSINPGGVTAISAATVNWTAGQNIGNAGTFTLNSSRQLEAVFGPGNGAHMTIDITGYYL